MSHETLGAGFPMIAAGLMLLGAYLVALLFIVGCIARRGFSVWKHRCIQNKAQPEPKSASVPNRLTSAAFSGPLE